MLPDDMQLPDKSATVDSGLTLKDMEREAIKTTLEQEEGNKSRSAKLLGIARQTLLNKIKEYGL